MFINKDQKNFRINYNDYLPLWAKVSYNQLALYGVHIGHSVDNLTPYSSWMVLGSRQGLCLINMFKFMYMFRGGLFIVQALIRRRSPIWFVNLDQSSQSIIKSAAMECGEYWVNENWINGLLTNFHRITKAARRTMKTPRIMWSSRQHGLIKNFQYWAFTRYTWPRAVFVSNVFLSYNVCQEAMNLRIPTLGIVDTNSPQKYVNMAIPGNDESFTSVGFYNNLISMFILYNKFSAINLWYINRLSYVKNNFHTNIKNNISNIYNYSNINTNKLHVNLNEFAFSSPVSNIKYGTLNHYQDIWKTRGVQLMYDLSKPSQLSRKNLILNLNSFYNKNQTWLYALGNIYKYNKKWARALKKGKKNRKFKVRIGGRKGAKLYKKAWYFLQRGRVATARLLRNQSFNFWKLTPYLLNLNIPRDLVFMYRRYLRRVYWFPKSQLYADLRYNIYNLLSTWFFVQFSRKRILFSNFFHRFNLKLTNSIKQRRTNLRKQESIQIRKTKYSNYTNTKHISNAKFIANIQNHSPELMEQNYIDIGSSPFLAPWYLRVMGLRHSLKKNTFLKGNSNKPLFVNLSSVSDIRCSEKQTLSPSMNITTPHLSDHSYCIKYVYNEWVTNSHNSRINNSNLINYYYNNNVPVLKPLTSSIFTNTFVGTRSHYIN